MTSTPSCELIDSGEGARLERFGTRVIQRPASSAIWKRAAPKAWDRPDAAYYPKEGWRFSDGQKFEQWEIEIAGLRMLLSLQNNGQIGIFPEHLGYLDELGTEIKLVSAKSGDQALSKVLNLFAYTGLVTNFAALRGAHVTHVEISKKIIDWAANNVKRNQINPDLVRFIADEAITFVAREVRRGNHYQIIVCDPPSFSREKKGDSWELEQVIIGLIKDLIQLIDPAGGTLFISSHHLGIGPEGIKNLIVDQASDRLVRLDSRTLILSESGAKRSLASGFLVQAQIGSLAK